MTLSTGFLAWMISLKRRYYKLLGKTVKTLSSKAETMKPMLIIRLKKKWKATREKELKIREIRSAILDGIISDGGVCKTKGELERMFQAVSGKSEFLKNELCYRKIF